MNRLFCFPKRQAPQDWITQYWNILCGRRFDANRDAWLDGPIGRIGGISDKVIEQIAASENLTIERNPPRAGLLDSYGNFPEVSGRLRPEIENFYRHTSEFEMFVWSEWSPVFGSAAYLIDRVYSRRLEQLNLPQSPLDTAHVMCSEVIYLRTADGEIRYRLWLRHLKKNNRVVYSGIYCQCVLPSGEPALKIIFPLPQGSATVVLSAKANEDGSLELVSRGRRAGDPGFYFLVEDAGGRRWLRYLRSFQERLRVYVDDEGELRADHAMSLWGWRAYALHYHLRPRAFPALTSEPAG